jgi:hypothetical protein
VDTFHKIKAQLYENVLTENPNDFIARVVSEKSLTIGEVARAAVRRGGADIPAEAMEHAVTLFLREMAYHLCDGYSINTGYFTAQPTIRGVFTKAQNQFDRDKHSVLFDLHAGSLLRKELENVEVEIVGFAAASLYIIQVLDVKSGSIDDLLTPNRPLKIAGSKIKIAGDNSDNGIYFVSQETGKRTKVDLSDIVTNNPSEVIVVIPDLTSGEYKIEVVTQYGSGNLLKEAKTTVFEQALTVQ